MRQALLPAVLLIVVTGVLYLPTLHYPFVYEDRNDEATFLAEASIGDYAARVRHRPTRALTEASFAVNRALFGADNPVGYHAGSIVVHLVNVALLLVLAWCCVSPVTAMLIALAFAVHPLNVEAVAYVSARGELVAASGVLLALLATSCGSFAGALCGVLLACLGKETAVMAWGLVPLWAVVTGSRFPVRRWLVTTGVVAVAGVLLLPWPHVAFGVDLGMIGRAAAAIWRFVALIVVPVGLTIDHDWHVVPLWLQFVGAWGLLACSALAWYLAAEWRSWLAVAWLAMVLWFLPRFVVPAPEGLHEHHMYFPLAVWLLCAGAWLSRSPIRA